MARACGLSGGTRTVTKLGRTRLLINAGLLGAALALSSCVSDQVIHHGFVDDQNALDFIPAGSSREQVLLSLGSPSTTSKIGADDVYYYISQKKVRKFQFQRPKLVEQRVLAVYFNQEATVERVANYGLKDGRVFDFISRTTPTGWQGSVVPAPDAERLAQPGKHAWRRLILRPAGLVNFALSLWGREKFPIQFDRRPALPAPA